MKAFILTIAGLLTSALAIVSVWSPAQLVIWNVTESTTTGVYFYRNKQPERYDIVAVMPRYTARQLLTARGYLPENTPLMKQVRGVVGDEICRFNDQITLGGAAVATALLVDSFGRSMPIWEGCFVLNDGEYFLLNEHEKSLDGRYFGPTKSENIIGVYQLVWAF